MPCPLALSSWAGWRIWRRQSHVTAKHLLSALMAIPDRSSSLNNLANAVSTRFEQLGRMEDLEEAITCHREALALRPHGHPYRSSSLSNLANAMSTRFGQSGSKDDLLDALKYLSEAKTILPTEHPAMRQPDPISLSGFSCCVILPPNRMKACA
jgi:tetratricopeptide (TPR) repeat protein